uniref:Variant surface glycoprotein 1125.275 n=1 Tax=Trypanosoma brucei TaxID=5691 RepID=A0A1J0R5L6_9TRYP|nr:variant surface glycoprotein 1125.275 [Trypanosoma brucei]
MHDIILLRTVVTLLAAISVLSFQLQPAAANDEAVNAVTDICSEIVFLEELKHHFDQQITTAETRVHELASQTLQLTAAAVKQGSGSSARAFWALVALSGTRLQKQIVVAKQARKGAISKATLAIADRLAQLKIAATATGKTLGAIAATAHAGDATTFGASGHECTSTVQTRRGDYRSCKAKADNKGALAQAAQQLTSMTQYIGVATDIFRPPQLTVVIAAKGTPTSVTQNSGDHCHDATGNSRPARSHALGIKSIEFSAISGEVTTISFSGPQATDDGCPTVPSDEADEVAITANKLANLICKARKSTITNEETIKPTTVANLQSDPTMQDIAALLENREKAAAKEISNENDKAKKEAVSVLFGPQTADIGPLYLHKLGEKDVDYKLAGKEVKGSLKDLVDRGDFGITLSFFMEHNKQTPCQASNTEPPKALRDSESCKIEKDKDKCNDKDGCEFKDGECKVKDGAKAENDSKNTNTTGSNSFVINRAPLLLAVLLL